MKILITGAAGFAGSHLVELLSAKGSDVILALSRKPREPGARNLRWLACDLLESSAVNEIIDSTKPDAIYHLAAYPSPQNSFQYPVRAVNETTAMQINLMEACLKAGIKPRFLLTSSGQIYGQPLDLPVNETARIDCTTPYAAAKFCQETIANYYSHRGLEIIIARSFNHTGPRQKRGFLVADLAYQVAAAEASPRNKVLRVGNLASKRDFTDVRDVAVAYSKLLGKGRPGEAYNICSGRSVSGQDILAMLIKRATGEIKVELDESKLRPADIPDLRGDYAKLARTTGWQPTISLERTLADTLGYWREEIRAGRASPGA